MFSRVTCLAKQAQLGAGEGLCSRLLLAELPYNHRTRCLTLRSSRAPTAGHQAREAFQAIFRLAGLASHRWVRLSSNVRHHETILASLRTIALLPLLLGGCAAPEDFAPTLPAALVGVWCNSNDGGRSCWAWDEFTEHGTLTMCGLQEEDLLPFQALATVTFTGRRLCYQVVEASANFWLKPGQRYCTEIVEVLSHSHVYRDLDSGKQFKLLRRPSSQKQCQPVAQRGGA
jgi:hypothetical protein